MKALVRTNNIHHTVDTVHCFKKVDSICKASLFLALFIEVQPSIQKGYKGEKRAIWETALHTAAEPAVRSAVQILVS